jgi:glycosyltransferase involved in cell wall biosynthesis
LTVVASLTPCKGHAFLLDALPEVLAHYPKLRVAFVGDGEIAASLKAQVTRLGLESCTMFLGYRHDVPDMIQAADLFVMPSLTEGLGTSLLDAMFARVPIVTTGAGGIADVI